MGTVVLAAFAVGVGGSPPALAGICPNKTLCVYEDNNFGGEVVKIKGEGVSNKIKEKLNNQASSVINNRGKRSILYDGKNGNGDSLCLSPGAVINTLSSALFSDVASSSKLTKKTSACPT